MAENSSADWGASALTPNRYETEHASKSDWRSRCLAGRGPQAGRRSGVEGLPGNTGSRWHDTSPAGRCRTAPHIGTAPREVYDVVGGGDIVLKIFCLFLIGDADATVAAQLATVRAGGQQAGCLGGPRMPLTMALEQASHGSRAKISGLAELLPQLERRRRPVHESALPMDVSTCSMAGHIDSLEWRGRKPTCWSGLK